jgi:hypothetical protein
MNYLTWNNRIASHFFKPDMAGQRICLYVSEETIGGIGAPHSSDVADFIDAVKAGPPWATRQGLCQRALQTLHRWRDRGQDYPPYIAYLALFVLAAGIDGDFSSIAYYPRLRALLDDDPSVGQVPSFDRMWELWFDLETWSNQDKSGTLGIFSVTFPFSKWIHIGLPVAQTLLTKSERDSLPAIFAKADIDPLSPPSDVELSALLREHGRDGFHHRTLRLLEGVGEEEGRRRAVLIELILEELREWDGIASVSGLSGQPSARHYASLRLCCDIDTVAAQAQLTLRCRSKHNLPEDGLMLTLDSRSAQFRCEEVALGWSAPLSAEIGGPPVDASSFNWSEGLSLKDADLGWILSLPPSPIRIFVSGAQYDLPGIVETRRLPSGSPFYLAARENAWVLLRKWGALGCAGFKELTVRKGMPKAWAFFYADCAHSDELIKGEYPLLSLPSTLRLYFDGGIRVSRGQQFFRFAPPRLVLEGAEDSTTLSCNGVLTECSRLPHTYELPREVLSASEVTVEVRTGDDILSRRVFLVDGPIQPTKLERSLDRFGADLAESRNGVTGALAPALSFIPFDFRSVVRVPDERRVFYIGSEPGQIVSWPSDPLPTDWAPVWAIPMRKRGRAVFCGTDLSTAEPQNPRCADQKKVKEWKELLWHGRKRIAEPTQMGLRALWLRFQEEARRV